MFDEINVSYSKAFEKFGDTSSSVMIPKNNQYLRFDSVISFLPKKNHLKIIDYGCGLAHFYEHLIANWPYEFEYIGVDINKEFLDHNKTKYKEATFVERDKFLLMKNKFDFVVCIGTFNLKYKKNNFENQQFVFQEIQKIWDKTQKSLYVNFMSTVVDFQQENAYHQDVGSIYKFFCARLTRNVVIDSTYLPYEFSIVGNRKENQK